MNGKGNGQGYEPTMPRRPDPAASSVQPPSENGEQAVMRRRVMHYAEQMRRMSNIIHELSERADGYEDKRVNWYEPELVKLKEEVGHYDNVRSTWYEPQLELRQQRILHLEQTAEAYEAERHSYFVPALAQRDARIAELEQQVLELQAQLAATVAPKKRRSGITRLLGIAPR
ncbi:hypothetical protein RHIZ404_190420 [Rhizobium sp. EC-SD404]|nr:hypothetical protein RHIZ404_190420 [Rhizobium sp. EC-SD404]